MKKRIFALLLVCLVMMTALCFTACGGSKTKTSDDRNVSAKGEEISETKEFTGGILSIQDFNDDAIDLDGNPKLPYSPIKMYKCSEDAYNNAINIQLLNTQIGYSMNFSYTSQEYPIYSIGHGIYIKNNKESDSFVPWTYINQVGNIQTFQIRFDGVDETDTVIFPIYMNYRESKSTTYYIAFRLIPPETSTELQTEPTTK